MKDPKKLPVKTYVNVSEYLDFEKACVIAGGVPHSKILRDLLNDWVKQVKSTEAATQKKGNSLGPTWSLPNPHSRVNYGIAPVRLRV